ncbi:TPA: hypothetical protein DIC20_00255 [Candidatus Dependentiae bacterium]|nr:hypothetical protein [Candidatus Dependentiae bacterium]HCU00118.1 hypothetical protein [Candidatus Dependentiae bacterium]
MNILKNIDLKDGTVVYCDFDIDFNLPFQNQKWSYKEDLIQIYFNDGGYIIDVGWYPEFDAKGKFVISIIKNYDWDKPIFEKKCKNKNLLVKYMEEAIEKVKGIR